MAKRKRRAKRPGLSPGSAVFTGEQRVPRALVRCIDFDAERLVERSDLTLEELGDPIEGGVRWVDVVGLHDVELIKELTARFGVHPLTTEDVLNPRTRPKLEDFETYAFFTIKVLLLDPKAPVGI